MKKILFVCLLLTVVTSYSFSQLTVAAEGGNKKAMVGERIGITDVTIHYDRPAVKGREGKIWGNLIHVGYADLGFGTSKAAPWRAGANENTTIEFSNDVKIEGQSLPAGKYGFFIAYDPAACTVIFSKNSSSWGSYFYDTKEDALRVTVKPATTDKSVERLKYEFSDQTDNSAVITLYWEKLAIPFKVEVDIDKIQLASFRNELRGERSFIPGWQSYVQAARYTLERNTNLEEGLGWANQAVSGQFVGEANFTTLSTKADILTKLGRQAEADSAMKRAMPMASMTQLHQYGRQLIAQKRPKEALEAFKLNYQKNPDQYTTLMGMTRGYAANGDFDNASKFAVKAQAKAPDEQNKKSVANIIVLLKEKKDIN